MWVVVPGASDVQSARVCVVQFDCTAPPSGLELRCFGAGNVLRSRHAVSQYTRLSGGGSPAIYVAWLTLSKLTPATLFSLRLVDAGGAALASAQVETLPEQLPTTSEGVERDRPFTIWFSSCFHAPNAPSGLQALVARLFGDTRTRPHLKLMLGDQVYLDNPLWRWMLAPTEHLNALFNESYARTWLEPGFRSLLASGANLFLPGDHEYWNDFPHPPFPVIARLRSEAFWQSWRALARLRLDTLQAGSAVQRIDLGGEKRPELSLRIVDALSERSLDGVRLMSDQALDEIVAWLRGLRCPGVLALGQPVFSLDGGAFDDKLVSYRQFRQKLLGALHASGGDVVLLTGDCHFGSVATTQLGHGRRLIELVSSPLALVNDAAAGGGRSNARPRRFPASSDEGEAAPIEYLHSVPTYNPSQRFWQRTIQRAEEHGMTAAFVRSPDGGVKLSVRPWYARAESSAAPWTFNTTLHAS